MYAPLFARMEPESVRERRSWRNLAIILRGQFRWFHLRFPGCEYRREANWWISAQADDLFLGAPEQREIEPSEQLDDGQVGWLAACHNSFNNRGSEKAERQQLAHVARRDLLASGERTHRGHATGEQVLRPFAATAIAFSKGNSTRFGADSPSSMTRVSLPRRLICMGTSLDNGRLAGLVGSPSSGDANGSWSARWRLSRRSWTRSTSPPNASTASSFEVSRSVQVCAAFRTAGNRCAQAGLFERQCECRAVAEHTARCGRDSLLDSGAPIRHPSSVSFARPLTNALET